MRIQTKMALFVSVCILGVAVPTAAAIGLMQWRSSTFHYEAHATVLAQAVLNQVELKMVSGDLVELERHLEKVEEDPAVAKAILMDPGGRDVFSGDPGDSPDPAKPRAIAEALASGEPVTLWGDGEGQRHIGVLLPVANKPECHACHSPEEPFLGVLELGLEAESLIAERGWFASLLGLSGLVAVLLVVGILVVGLQRLVAHRVARLQAMAARIATGDYGVRSDVGGRDEISALGRSMEDMADQLGDLDRRKSEFISIASHQLRTPLTVILGFTEVLKHRAVSADERSQALESMASEGNRLKAMVDDLLSVSRIQSGRLEARLEPLALGGVVEEVVSSIRMLTDRHEFVLEVPPGLPAVMADRDKLSQVLVNLLDNAVKYSPAGGRISIAATYEAERGRVVVGVADQGVGIAEEDIDHLFRTFSRIRRTDTVSVRGTGLGLYIVREMVGLMGGEVWVESRLGAGSTFYFTLPT